jgi:OOP family OmpA-OmpF porin
MKAAKVSRILGLAALAIIGGSFAMAQDPGWYVGGNVGRTKADVENSQVPTRDGVRAGMSDFDRGTGFKVFGGYEINRYLAFEGGYFDLGKMNYVGSTVPPSALSGGMRVQGLDLDAVGFLPFTAKFAAFARAGVTRATTRDDFSGSAGADGYTPNPLAKRAWNAKGGVGLQYQFNQTLGARAEFERYRITDAFDNRGDVDMASVGLVLRFGRRAALATPAPEPVAEMPAQPQNAADAPVVVVVPVAAPTQQYCTILDLQFTVDNDQIQREDSEKLAVVGTFLTKYPDATAVIEGHSDNVGTPEHNLKLSQARADSVVKYLEDTEHIAPSRLSAVGYGEAHPVADNATEEGKRQNRRIDAVIACVTDVQGLVVAPARMTMALYIDYDANKASIKPQYDGELLKVADFLKANPNTTATVEGHTGNLQGSPKEAMAISQLRAQNVVNYLADHFAIDRSRLSAKGYGKNRRFAYNTSPEGQQENRRINIIINYPQ